MKLTSIVRRSTAVAATALALQFALVPASVSAAGTEQGSSNGQPFVTLQGEIDLLSADPSEAAAFLQEQIDDLVEAQADPGDVIAALQAAIVLLEARVALNEMDIATLVAWHELQSQLIAALDGRLADLELRIAADDDDIAALVLADQTLQQLIGAVQQGVFILTQMVALKPADGAELRAELADLRSELADLQAELASARGRVFGLCPRKGSIRQINADGTIVCETKKANRGAGPLQSFRVMSATFIPSSTFERQTRWRTATCPSGSRVTGGGFGVIGGNLGLGQVEENHPNTSNGWFAQAVTDGVGSRVLKVYAQCSRVHKGRR